MFQRLEAILESEIESLGSPKAALLKFTTAVLAYNVLAVLKRSVEQAHRDTQPEGWEASTYHLAVQVRSSYEGMQIALPPEYLPVIPLEKLAQRLLELARNIQPKQVAKSPAAPAQAQGMGPRRSGACACFNGQRHQGCQNEKTLKRMAVRAEPSAAVTEKRICTLTRIKPPPALPDAPPVARHPPPESRPPQPASPCASCESTYTTSPSATSKSAAPRQYLPSESP